jgi:hypothetical protein
MFNSRHNTHDIASSGIPYADVLKYLEAKIINQVKPDINQANKKEERVNVFNYYHIKQMTMNN